MTEQNEQLETAAAPQNNPLVDIATDIATLGGAASVTFGCWQVYHPSGFIVGGAFMLAASWIAAAKGVG